VSRASLDWLHWPTLSRIHQVFPCRTNHSCWGFWAMGKDFSQRRRHLDIRAVVSLTHGSSGTSETHGRLSQVSLCPMGCATTATPVGVTAILPLRRALQSTPVCWPLGFPVATEIFWTCGEPV